MGNNSWNFYSTIFSPLFLVFCPRYRKKFFNNPHTEPRFKELIFQIAKQYDMQILAIECDKDHTHIFVNALPKYSPAVGVVNSTGKTKFFGNGRSNKYLRRKYKELRKKLCKAKKLNAIKRINDKESRIIKDINHKISRQIVDFAVENNCGTINLENLSDIRQTSRIRGKNKQSLHSWTFYQLASFVEYKAYNLGIKVEYINSQYTSQECPV